MPEGTMNQGIGAQSVEKKIRSSSLAKAVTQMTSTGTDSYMLTSSAQMWRMQYKEHQCACSKM